MDERSNTAVDLEKFRLRHFVDMLATLPGEVRFIDANVKLSCVAVELDDVIPTIVMRDVGPEGTELVGNVMGTRRRMALALGVDETRLAMEVIRRLETPQPVVDVPSDEAPVHEVVMRGDEVDLTQLPFHLQHERDGGLYISSGIDYTVDPATGRTNVGCRRLMLRNRNELGFNATAPSDLQNLYRRCVAENRPLPVSFTLGSHPVDFLAGAIRLPDDELSLVSRLRGEPLGVVKCLTNDIRVPADAEMVLEGYIDPRGYVEQEGPYGEYMGFYGPMHPNPVFHVTAVTMRKDALHQTVIHGMGRHLSRHEASHMCAILTEVTAWRKLQGTARAPVAVRCTAESNGLHHLYASIRQTAPGESRNVLSALLSMPTIKHVFLTDADINIFDDEEMEWAFSTRFQADRDMMIHSGHLAMPMDPSLQGARVGARAGFDLTFPFGTQVGLLREAPTAAVFDGKRTHASVEAALTDGPKSIAQLMAALGSDDGREIVMEINSLREAGRIDRAEEGAFVLKK